MSSDLTKLPAVIQSFISATNQHDSESYINTFAGDALVNDAARSFWGKEAIKRWSDKEIIGDKVTIKLDEVREHYGDYIITFLIDGNYDKSKAPDPTFLDFFFTLKGSKVTTLIITKNKQKSAK
jgi:ketosteroid isomerase-like protein